MRRLRRYAGRSSVPGWDVLCKASVDTMPATSSLLAARVSRQMLIRIIPFWVLCVIVGSFLPGPTKVAIGTTTPVRLEAAHEVQGIAHRSIHFAVFGVTAILFLLVARNGGQEILAVFFALGLGTVLEVLQHLSFGSVLEWWDIRDDAIGVLAAFVLVRGFGLAEMIVAREPKPLMVRADVSHQ